MNDWSISRHSYVRPRLLGQVKEEFVHSNLCSEHSFLSPSYDILKKNKVISNHNHVKMKELRESLRQAALINIVAAVNDGDVDDIMLNKDELNGNQSDVNGTLCDQSNQQIRQRLTDRSNANETPKLQSARRPVGYHERQKLCPKMKLSDALSVNYSNRELSILEGHQLITATPLQELTTNTVTKKRKKKLKPKLNSDQGDTLVIVNAVKETATYKSLGQKKQVPCSNLVVNDFGIIENTHRNENIRNLERGQEIDTPFSGLQKMSEVTSDRKFESESESVSSKDSKNSQKCVLHISTKDGEIGRSAGFFPPPGFKRETPTLKRESKPSKCDAVDILESSSPEVIEKSVFISSQRDNFGELGNCLFGLKKSSSLPTVPTSVKRKKLKPKTDKELIMSANPLGKSLSDKPIQLDDGVVGTNIRNDSNRGDIDNHTPTLNRHLIKPSVSHIVIPTDLSISSIYHLAEERLETPKACRDITLEGHGLPSVNSREKKVLPVQPNKIDLWTRRDSETKHHLSNQIYDFQGLPLDRSPDDRQTIQDIQPIVRKAGVIPNASPSVYYTPRPRPINASMSTIKHVDEQIRPSNGKVAEQDLSASDLDLVIHASKLEDCGSTRGPSGGDSRGDKQYMISKSRSSGYKGSISNLSDDEISKDNDDLYDSEASSDVDITKIDPPQTPIMRKVTSCASAKHQGTSSMSTNKDILTKLHVINNTDIGKETTVKILKSYDQELYADFTHRKHRNSHFTKSGDDDLKVVHVKVRCSNREPAEPNHTVDEHSDASDSD